MEDKKLPKNDLIHDFNGKKTVNNLDVLVSSKKSNLIIFVVIITLILGIGTGFIASQTAGGTKGPVSLGANSGSIKTGATFGVNDSKNFPDSAEGVLKEGGVNGEGAYHLERTGGVSQNVYMTSSAIDLSQFIGKKVKVWGQTQTAQTAGWLMDVGKLEVM